MNYKVTNPIITLISLVLSLVAFQTALFSQSVVQRKLYLSSGGVLDRIDPFASGDLTLDSSDILVKSSVVKVNNTTTPVSLGPNGSSVGVDSFSYVIASGSNRLLIVAVGSETSGATVSSVVYGNQPLQKYQELVNGITRIQLWYLINPDVSSTKFIKYYWPA